MTVAAKKRWTLVQYPKRQPAVPYSKNRFAEDIAGTGSNAATDYNAVTVTATVEIAPWVKAALA